MKADRPGLSFYGFVYLNTPVVTTYYLTVERLNRRGSYPIKETITSNPNVTWTDIYGLSSGSYIVTSQSIGGSYEMINSHRTKLLVTNYNGTSYMNDWN